jgi:hypothetical protein
METSQNVQYEPDQVRTLAPEKIKGQLSLTPGSNALVYLLTHYPWLLLTGLLAFFLGSATFAVFSLGNVGRVEQKELEKIPTVAEEPIKPPSEHTSPTPLWLVVAIALCCASGCFVILRLVNRPEEQQKVKKRINRYQARATQHRYQRPEPRAPKNPPMFVPQQPLTSLAPILPKPKRMVTVLPPEQSIYLDKHKESLADMLDIRKQSSLSSILRK